jgi:hypothetical protein
LALPISLFLMSQGFGDAEQDAHNATRAYFFIGEIHESPPLFLIIFCHPLLPKRINPSAPIFHRVI